MGVQALAGCGVLVAVFLVMAAALQAPSVGGGPSALAVLQRLLSNLAGRPQLLGEPVTLGSVALEQPAGRSSDAPDQGAADASTPTDIEPQASQGTAGDAAGSTETLPAGDRDAQPRPEVAEASVEAEFALRQWIAFERQQFKRQCSDWNAQLKHDLKPKYAYCSLLRAPKADVHWFLLRCTAVHCCGYHPSRAAAVGTGLPAGFGHMLAYLGLRLTYSIPIEP